MTRPVRWYPPTLVADPVTVTITPSMADVLSGLCCGHSNAEIAARLYVSEDTVKTHVRRLFTRLGVHTRGHAAALACSGQINVQVAKYVTAEEAAA